MTGHNNLLITAKNLNYARNGKTILDNVSLEIRKNDFITIVGPNGAGKTTLLKILIGIKKADSGTVHSSKKIKIGYLPQKIGITNSIPMSSQYFLKLNANLDAEHFDKIVEETKIQDILHSQICELSGGEIQKLLLANALLKKPDLLVLDEPDQNLDVSGQLQFYKLLDDIFNKRKISILMVSHDLRLVMSSTKKVVCLFKHICCSGKPETISKDPSFTAIFGENASQIMSVYNHLHNHKH